MFTLAADQELRMISLRVIVSLYVDADLAFNQAACTSACDYILDWKRYPDDDPLPHEKQQRMLMEILRRQFPWLGEIDQLVLRISTSDVIEKQLVALEERHKKFLLVIPSSLWM
jgi:hypothetical protein